MPRPRSGRDPEPEKTVADAQAEAEARDFKLDKTGQWRFDKLLAAGYTETQALWLALDRGVDLHRAVELAELAGPPLAFRIVN